MIEKIELNIEQAWSLIANMVQHGGSFNIETGEIIQTIKTINVDKTISAWKKQGYIKQNPVEKAERFFERYEYGMSVHGGYTISTKEIEETKEAIEYLKKQLEETK